MQKFHCAPLRIKKALGIFTELITTTTTRVALWDLPSRSKNGPDQAEKFMGWAGRGWTRNEVAQMDWDKK